MSEFFQLSLRKILTMTDIRHISIDDYDYPLPEARIAKYPLAERDASKLLVLKNSKIQESVFRNIGDFLPEKSLLVFNETKVIRARLQFQKKSGSHIEVFCLEPMSDYQIAFASLPPVRWKCLVGNSKRWHDEPLEMVLKSPQSDIVLTAKRIEKNDQYSIVEFSWTPSETPFATVLEIAGEIPLPPYLHRDAEPDDRTRYQTVFARFDGSVAAPTAGLHFTMPLIGQLHDKGFEFDEVTLHVGAGTFKPVSAATIGEHAMHSETIIVRKSLIDNLLTHLEKHIIPVGTTSTRTLESLYWIGILLHEKGMDIDNIHLDQWFPYESHDTLSAAAALEKVSDYLESNKLTQLEASTALMIAPGYNMRVINGLITNFHQPKSTLLLLVAALIGNQWKDAYRFALDHDFRFLSYGDSCLFLPEQ